MKNVLFAFLFIVPIGCAYSQISIAPVAGLNISGYAAKKDPRYVDPELNKRNGLCGGALMFVPIARKLSVQSGILYKMNGYWETFHGETPFGIYNVVMIQRVSTLEVPCKLMYSFKGKRGNSFFLGAGPYFALNVASSMREKGELLERGASQAKNVDQIYYDKIGTSESMTKRYDAGAGLTMGYRSRKGILICLQAQRGWMDARAQEWDWQAVNYNFDIVGGYTFKLKNHKALPAEPRGKAE